MKTNRWYACEEHVDIVLEDFVDTFEIPPLMDLCLSPPPHAKCKWCGKKPKYLLATEDETAE
ncbi:MAG: CxxH/CxxC protein [Thermoactinomyces sp.]